MMHMMLARVLAVCLVLPLPLAAAQLPARELPVHEGRYYVIHTDLTGEDLREAELRMSKMAEEYKTRTREFSGTIGHKFSFFLFQNREDFYAAGGQRGSAGMFNANTNTLMALAGEEIGAQTWHVVQHEGFHQFARAVIGGELPIWVNEGLAEYFGESLFTGDGFISGAIPPSRLKRVKKQLRDGEFRPIKEMMFLDHRTWNEELDQANYDQAWSMVQFLAHADEGRYQRAFVGFMRQIGTGVQWDRAWLANFGSAEGFEEKWRSYWLKLPDSPTPEVYLKALTQTMTSALARATAQRQKFASFEQLLDAGKSGAIKMAPHDWLPPKLISGAFTEAEKLRERGARFELVTSSGRLPDIVCTWEKIRVVGQFTLTNGRVSGVTARQ